MNLLGSVAYICCEEKCAFCINSLICYNVMQKVHLQWILLLLLASKSESNCGFLVPAATAPPTLPTTPTFLLFCRCQNKRTHFIKDYEILYSTSFWGSFLVKQKVVGKSFFWHNFDTLSRNTLAYIDWRKTTRTYLFAIFRQ